MYDNYYAHDIYDCRIKMEEQIEARLSSVSGDFLSLSDKGNLLYSYDTDILTVSLYKLYLSIYY